MVPVFHQRIPPAPHELVFQHLMLIGFPQWPLDKWHRFILRLVIHIGGEIEGVKAEEEAPGCGAQDEIGVLALGEVCDVEEREVRFLELPAEGGGEEVVEADFTAEVYAKLRVLAGVAEDVEAAVGGGDEEDLFVGEDLGLSDGGIEVEDVGQLDGVVVPNADPVVGGGGHEEEVGEGAQLAHVDVLLLEVDALADALLVQDGLLGPQHQVVVAAGGADEVVLQVHSDRVDLAVMRGDLPLLLPVEGVLGQFALGGADQEAVEELGCSTHLLFGTAHDEDVLGPAIAEAHLPGVLAGDDPQGLLLPAEELVDAEEFLELAVAGIPGHVLVVHGDDVEAAVGVDEVLAGAVDLLQALGDLDALQAPHVVEVPQPHLAHIVAGDHHGGARDVAHAGQDRQVGVELGDAVDVECLDVDLEDRHHALVAQGHNQVRGGVVAHGVAARVPQHESRHLLEVLVEHQGLLLGHRAAVEGDQEPPQVVDLADVVDGVGVGPPDRLGDHLLLQVPEQDVPPVDRDPLLEQVQVEDLVPAHLRVVLGLVDPQDLLRPEPVRRLPESHPDVVDDAPHSVVPLAVRHRENCHVLGHQLARVGHYLVLQDQGGGLVQRDARGQPPQSDHRIQRLREDELRQRLLLVQLLVLLVLVFGYFGSLRVHLAQDGRGVDVDVPDASHVGHDTVECDLLHGNYQVRVALRNLAAEEGGEVCELDAHFIASFFYDLPVEVDKADGEVEGLVGVVRDGVEEKAHELVEGEFLVVHLQFVESLIDFEAVEVAEVELVVVFGEQASVALRIPDHIAHYLFDQPRRMHHLLLFFFHCKLYNSIIAFIMLTHLPQLSLHPYFAPSELKQMMPHYQSSTPHNLFTIFRHFIAHGYSKLYLLVPDPSLAHRPPFSPLYAHTHVLWDHSFYQKLDHLKNTLCMGASLVNYIFEEQIQAKKRKEEGTQDRQRQPQLQSDCEYLKRVETLECRNGTVKKEKSKYGVLGGRNKVVGYNFVQKEGKIYAIFGFSEQERDSSVICSYILRQWNLGRLQISQIGQQIQVENLHCLVEHVFGIARGFMREFTDDYNTLKVNLRNCIERVERSELHGAQVLQALSDTKIDNDESSVTQLITYRITFRQALSQEDLWDIIKQSVTEWLARSPVNVSCSYASSLVHEEGTHNLILTLATSYKQYESKAEAKMDLESCLDKVGVNIQALLSDNVGNNQQQQPDPVRDSMKIVRKYRTPANTGASLSLSRNSNQADRTSARINTINESKLSDSSSRVDIKRIAKIENQVYDLVMILESNHKILTPAQIQKGIHSYTDRLQKQHQSMPGYGTAKEEQCKAIKALQAITEELGADDIYLLLRHHPNDTALILDAFMQNSRYDCMIVLGKIIAKDHLEELYTKSLESGLCEDRNSLLPFFLKKMVMRYGKLCKWEPLQADLVGVPELVEVIQSRKYGSHSYNSILEVVVPQLFKGCEEAIKPISPLISLYLQFLMGKDHHFEIVYSFIGELMYETCYFTHQLKFNALSNAVYLEEKYSKEVGIKDKRILFMLREGGFKGFGYEVKNSFLDYVAGNRNFLYPEPFIYYKYTLNKQTDLLRFFKIVSSSHYTPDTFKAAQFLQANNNFASALTQPTPIIAFFPISAYDPSHLSSMKVGEDVQFNSLSERILKSESGIFEDMVRLNPKVKIAGIELTTVMKNLSDSRVSLKRQRSKNGCIDAEEAVQTVFPETLRRHYEYVELALSLKEKYISYQTLNEDEKQYFRICAQDLTDQKHKLMEYAALSTKVKQVTENKQK